MTQPKIGHWPSTDRPMSELASTIALHEKRLADLEKAREADLKLLQDINRKLDDLMAIRNRLVGALVAVGGLGGILITALGTVTWMMLKHVLTTKP